MLLCAGIVEPIFVLNKDKNQKIYNMLTIKDIAKMANVSVGTVDRVIHDRPGVSKKTKEKISKILKQTKFKQNPIASALAIRKKFKLCCLIPKHDSKNLFWKSPLRGIEKAKNQWISYGLETHIYKFNQFDADTYLKEFNKLIERKPDAVILAPTFYKQTEQMVSRLQRMKIPYIFLNIDIDAFNSLSFIGQDAFQAGIAAGKLISMTLKENQSCVIIGTRANLSNYSAISKRIKGFEKYRNDNGQIDKTHTLNFDDIKDLNWLKEQINTYLKNHPQIKGIYVPSSRVSVVANVINKDNLKDLIIIGFDTTEQNMECLENGKVKFIISQKSYKQGYKAVDTMANLLIYKKVPKSKIYSPIKIIIKENAKKYATV